MQKQVYKCPNHWVNLNNMRLNNKLCDVIIKVDGKEYPAHKNILAANLKHFEVMFSNDHFQESQNGIATMKNMKATDLEAFITYAYTGEITITDTNVLGLLEIADYFREDGIKKACIEFLEKHLKLEDACRIYRFASNTECLSLKNASKVIIMNNLENISQTDDFLDFDYNNVRDILSDRKALKTMRLQKMMFEGIIRWVIYDAHSRENYTSDLLSLVDIKEFTAEYLMSYLYANIIDGNDEHGISKTVMSCYYTSDGKNIKARYEGENLDKALMLIDLTDTKIIFRSYDFTQQKWFQLQEAPLSDGCSWTRFAVLDDKLYYIGGNSGTMNLRMFDPTTKEIRRLHSLRNNWCLSAMCACSKYLYFCGGVNADDSRSDQILKYDPKKYSLDIMPSMEGKRNDAAAVFYEGCLYVLGGFDGSTTLNSVEKYDPVTKTWSSMPSMLHPRRRHAVAILDGKLYACGGLNMNSVEVYDKVENSWRPLASMNQNRYYFIVIARQGKLWAIGGNRDKTVEFYEPSADERHIDPEMSLGSKMIVIGGGLISRSCITKV